MEMKAFRDQGSMVPAGDGPENVQDAPMGLDHLACGSESSRGNWRIGLITMSMSDSMILGPTTAHVPLRSPSPASRGSPSGGSSSDPLPSVGSMSDDNASSTPTARLHAALDGHPSTMSDRYPSGFPLTPTPASPHCGCQPSAAVS